MGQCLKNVRGESWQRDRAISYPVAILLASIFIARVTIPVSEK